MSIDDISRVVLDGFTVGVTWVVVPLIMAGLALLAHSMVLRSGPGDHKTSARAGGWAGLVLFFLYFVDSLGAFRTPGPDVEVGLELHVWAITVAALVSLGVLGGLSFLAPERVVGFVVLILTFSGLTTFHSYLFLESRNELFIGAVLGAVLGTLLHMMVFPATLKSQAADPHEEEVGSTAKGSAAPTNPYRPPRR